MAFFVDFALFFQNDRRPVAVWYRALKKSEKFGLPILYGSSGKLKNLSINLKVATRCPITMLLGTFSVHGITIDIAFYKILYKTLLRKRK